MTSMVSLSTWLEHLKLLFCPQHVLLIGAGTGTGQWVKMLQRWQVPAVTLVEGDTAQFQQLKQNIQTKDGWQLLHDVIAADSQEVVFHHFNLTVENGVIPAEFLRLVWPNLHVKDSVVLQALSLKNLVEETGARANWLIVDCLNANYIVQGASSAFDTVDIVIARIGLSDLLVPELTVTYLDEQLGSLGFKRMAIEPGRHPSIGHALYVKDFALMRNALSQSTTEGQETKNKLNQLLSKNASCQSQLAEKVAVIEELQIAQNIANENKEKEKANVDALARHLEHVQAELVQEKMAAQQLKLEAVASAAQLYEKCQKTLAQAHELDSQRELHQQTLKDLTAQIAQAIEEKQSAETVVTECRTKIKRLTQEKGVLTRDMEELHLINARQVLLKEELIKAEAHIDLIKEFVLGLDEK